MKRFFQFLAASALVVSMQGCSKDSAIEPTPDSPVQLRLTGEINQTTRVNEAGFEANDAVGVYVSTTGTLATSGNMVDNAAFTYDSGELVAPEGSEVYWESSDTKLNVYAYYPYAQTVTSTSAYNFSVNADQSSLEGFFDSDFIYASEEDLEPTTESVELTFNHILSRINLAFVAGDGITQADLNSAEKTIIIKDLVTSGTVNLATGVATKGTSTANVTPYKNSDGTYSAIVYPQESSLTIILELNGAEFYCTTDIDITAGNQYKFNLKVSPWDSPEMTLSTSTINPWEGEGEGNVDMSNTLSFADPLFKEYLLNAVKYTYSSGNIRETSDKIDADGDREISKEEAEAVVFINASKGQTITPQSFTSVDGIEYFTNLLGIDLGSHASLTSIDVSANTKLQYLKVSSCPISSIDIEDNPSLQYLYCCNCGLTTLDLSNQPNMKYVDCIENPNLTTIYITEGVDYQYWAIQSGVTPEIKYNN